MRWTTKKKEASKTQQPRSQFWPNPGGKSFRWWKLDQTCGFSLSLQWNKEAMMQKPSNPGADYQTQAVSCRLPNLSDGNRIGCTVSRHRSSGGEEHMGFWGLEVESGTAFGEKGKEEQEKKSMFWLNWNRVQRARFPLNKTESFGLDFHEGKASHLGSISKPMWTVCLAQLLCNGKLSAIYSIYTPKSSPLDSICLIPK